VEAEVPFPKTPLRLQQVGQMIRACNDNVLAYVRAQSRLQRSVDDKGTSSALPAARSQLKQTTANCDRSAQGCGIDKKFIDKPRSLGRIFAPQFRNGNQQALAFNMAHVRTERTKIRAKGCFSALYNVFLFAFCLPSVSTFVQEALILTIHQPVIG